MKITYKTGSLLDAKEHYICHGCNAQGRMGSGVAKLIKEQYPKAYEVYLKHLDSYKLYGDGRVMGTVCLAYIDETRSVINAITQYNYGYDGDKYCDYAAIARAIKNIDCMAKFSQSQHEDGKKYFENPITEVAFPLIGAGLGGGDWDMISEIIDINSEYFQPVVYVLPDELSKVSAI